MEELIRMHQQTQEAIDKTLMEIGLGYSRYRMNKSELLKNAINDKVEFLQVLESRIQIIEKKIREHHDNIQF